MKVIARNVCATLLVSALPWPGAVQTVSAGANLWTTHGPEGGSISTLAIDPQTPTTLYVGTTGGVFKSTDGGGSWTQSGLNQSIRALAIDPQTPTTLYAGSDVWGSGVFKSTDGGGSWNAVNNGLTTTASGWTLSVYALALDPQSPITLYVGTYDGVFKSTDGGGSWIAANTGLTDYVKALAIDPQTPTTLYVGTTGGVFKSTDGGANWFNSGLPNHNVLAVAIDPQNSAIVYAGAYDGVFKSTDGGGSWIAANTGLPNHNVLAVAIDPQNSAIVYAGTYGGGIFKSTDGGGSWTPASSGLSTTIVGALAIDPQTPATLYAGTWAGGVYAGTLGSGVFKSTDGGGGWSAANTGLIATHVPAVAVDPQAPATLYAGTSGGVFKSTDGGNHWNAVNTGLGATSVRALAIDPQTPTTLYAGGASWLFKTTDGGASWSALKNPRPSSRHVLALAVDPQAPTTLYAGHLMDNVFKSADGGSTWSAAGLYEVYALAIDPQSPTILYAAPEISLYKSTDGGTSWSATVLAGVKVRALAVDPEVPTTVYAGARGYGNPSGVYKSIDGGVSWTLMNNGLPPNPAVSALVIDPNHPATLYAGTSGGVFNSIDGGASWTAMNDGLTNLSVQALALDPRAPSTLYAGTSGGGVFSRTASQGGPADTTPPTVAITSPSDGTTVSGTVTVSASVSDDVGVGSVQFWLDGWLLGAEVRTAPYSLAWDTATVSDGPHTLRAVARDTAGHATTSASVGVTVSNGVVYLSPQDTFLDASAYNFSNSFSNSRHLNTYTSPDYQVWNAILMKFDLASLPAGAVIQEATLYLALLASDGAADDYTVTAHKVVGRNPDIAKATGYTADGVTGWTPNACCHNNAPMAQADISPAYDARAIDNTSGYKVWTLTRMVQEWLADPAANFGLLLNADGSKPRSRFRQFASTEHLNRAVRPALRIAYRLASAADATPPTVAIASPSDGTTVSGTVTVSASATDDAGVSGVQFRLDGAPLGAEDASAPYEVAWDTRAVVDGPYTLRAVARDTAGNTATSAGVSVTVANGSVRALLVPQDTSLNLDAMNYSSDGGLMTYTWPDYKVANAILMKFDLSGLPAGAVVQEATLDLSLVQSDAMAESTYAVTAHKVEGKDPVVAAGSGYTADGVTSWTANACCYNGVPLAQADISPAYDTQAIDKAPGFKSWTLTAMVREWLANPATNRGLLLNSDAAKPRDRYRYFASTEHPDPALRPVLRVSYVAETSPPTATSTAP